MTESMDMDTKMQKFDEEIEQILDLLEEKAYFRAILEESGIDKTIIIYRMLPKDISAEVFSYLPSDDQREIIQGITDREVSYIMGELDFDDMIDVLEELPANIVDKILEKTPKEERKLINTFLNYPDTCAGSLMTPEYISLQETMTVGQALQHIRDVGMDSETVYTCYVKKGGRKLEGIVSLRALVIADDDVQVSELMNTEYVYVSVHDDQEEVAETFKKYGFLAIPVVDNEHRLVGIITFDDILDVIEEETTEDIERMAGVMKNRLPWLAIMMVALMITGVVISTFQDVLAQVIALVAYIPLLSGTGGNAGTQAASLIIRGMSTDEIDVKDALRVMWKEFRVSIILGLVLSAINFGKIILIDGNTPMIALTVSISMILVIIFAKLLGGLLPMAAKRIGIDPALMATPMISSITDTVSTLTYLLMATLILGLAL